MGTDKTPGTGIETACEIAGGGAALARLLEVSHPTVSQWINGTRPVPTNRCVEIEQQTGVSRRALRPQDWWRIWPELVDDEHPIPRSAA